MISLQSYDIYIFDCDGVILDSNTLKYNAFRDSLSGEQEEKVNKLLLYHIENGGISRYEKFNYFYRKLSPSEEIEKDCQKALIRFSKIVSKGLAEVDYVPGVIRFLNHIYSNSQGIFINSGSDEKELRECMHARGIDHLFEQIYGSPNSKEKNLQKIINKFGQQRKYIFFGDSKSDYLAAKSFDIDFVFISRFSEWNNPSGKFAYEAKDFNEFLNL